MLTNARVRRDPATGKDVDRKIKQPVLENEKETFRHKRHQGRNFRTVEPSPCAILIKKRNSHWLEECTATVAMDDACH